MNYLTQLIQRYPVLEPVRVDIQKARDIIVESFESGGKLLIAGNGGSAADAGHIAGELMKSFVKARKLPADFLAKISSVNSNYPEIAEYLIPHLQPGLPVINLSDHSSLNTACVNDIDGNIAFSQQAYAYTKKEDVFLGISTSGNAKNVFYAAAVAKAKGAGVIALSGGSGGRLKDLADVSIIVPEKETYKIQELHLPIYHCLCLMIEEHFF